MLLQRRRKISYPIIRSFLLLLNPYTTVGNSFKCFAHIHSTSLYSVQEHLFFFIILFYLFANVKQKIHNDFAVLFDPKSYNMEIFSCLLLYN